MNRPLVVATLGVTIAALVAIPASMGTLYGAQAPLPTPQPADSQEAQEETDADPFELRVTHDYTLQHQREVTFHVPPGVGQSWLTLAFEPPEDRPGCVGLEPSIELTGPTGERHTVQTAQLSTTLGNPICDSMRQERIWPHQGTWTVQFEGQGMILGVVHLEELR